MLVSARPPFAYPAGGSAQFNPVLFNYQSHPGNPAVLAILATHEGTSITVIENRTEDKVDKVGGAIWGQRLFFNQNGERASLTGQRLSDFRAEQAANPTPQDPHSAEVAEEALNLVMVIQVPDTFTLNSPEHGSGKKRSHPAYLCCWERNRKAVSRKALRNTPRALSPFTSRQPLRWTQGSGGNLVYYIPLNDFCQTA